MPKGRNGYNNGNIGQFVKIYPWSIKGVRKGGLGLKTPLELDILQNLCYLRKGN